MPSSSEAVFYIYENPGLQIVPSSPEVVAYIYENVGHEALTPSKESVGYIYENVGVEQGLNSKEGVVYIYEFVDAAAPVVPHLWKVFPTSGVADDEVEVWCHGLIPPSVDGDAVKFYMHVQVGWDGDDPIDNVYEMEQVAPASLVGASANAYGAARSIPPDDFEPNVEHWKAIVKVPASPSGLRKIRIQVYDYAP